MKKQLAKSLAAMFCLLATSLTIHAQSDRIHLGVISGLHSTSTSFSNLNGNIFNDPKSVMGATFGIFGEFELGDNRMFSLRPEFRFLSRGTKIEDISYKVGTGSGQLDYELSTQYTDLRVPVMINFGKPDGIRPYLFLAPTLGFVRGGDISVSDAISKYEIDVSKANMASTYLAISPGVGVKIPLGSIQLGVEVSYEVGLTDTYGSKEKDGTAFSNQFFRVYNIEGTRKFSGFEISAHVSIPLTIFKSSGEKKNVVYVEQPVTQKVKVKRKPCYELEEILSMIARGESVDGLTICAIDLINFEYNKSTLTRDSRLYIDKIVSLMKRTGISMEVKGHTDDRGTDEYNMNLSKRRAEAVYNYMLSKGVNRGKLSYSYYGKTQPIESNETDEGRRINRRVEFEIK